MPLADLLSEAQVRVEQSLERWLPGAEIHPSDLHRAMRYAAMAGGKRIRPTLVYATGAALGARSAALDGPACAVEMIHTYSLIHDDLPALDDDDLRRGVPTCHKVHGEAIALLAGDALQSLAFYVLAHAPDIPVDADRRLLMVEQLAAASGSRGMAGGQAIDLGAVGRTLDIVALEDMHIHKTGALIRASVHLGALSATCADARTLECLDHYAKCIGLAFQIQDDVLDVAGDTQTLGKTQGADEARNKPTYPALLGLAAARARALELHDEALAALEGLGPAGDPLRWIARHIIERVR